MRLLSLKRWAGRQPRQSEGRLSFVATGYTGASGKSAQMVLVGQADGKSTIYCEPAGGFLGIDGGGLMVGASGETTRRTAGKIWADGDIRIAVDLIELRNDGTAVFVQGDVEITGGSQVRAVSGGLAGGSSGNYWELGGYTGSAASTRRGTCGSRLMVCCASCWRRSGVAMTERTRVLVLVSGSGLDIAGELGAVLGPGF